MTIGIKDEIQYRGCNPNIKVIIPSKELTEISLYIESLNLKKHNLKKENLRKVLKSSQEFLNGIYDLHYVPSEIVIKNKIFKLEFSGDINPFKLPIDRIEGEDDFYGCLRETIITEVEPKIVFRKIELSKQLTEISQLSYTHEITHTQLNHMRGLIREYFNMEVLSIFNELIHAFHINDGETLLREHDSRRLYELAYAISEINKYYDTEDEQEKSILLEGSCYCQSTIKAYNLFIRYYYGTAKTRNHIIKSIQRVFDGEKTLEEVLESLDVSFENSQDIKTLKKYLNRG